MRARRIIAIIGVGMVIAAGTTALGAGVVQAATSGQCNAYAAVLAGQGMECSVTVDNYVDGPVEYSTITVQECHGAAFTVLLAPACVTTVIQNTELTLAVTQCNGSLNGGGSNVTCRVQINNYFSGTATGALVTVNQCVGSGADGASPTGPPLNCSSNPLTVGATVTQCNGSVNGGGGPLRVNCTVPLLAETAVPVTVDQCNGTVNGGGSVLFCSVDFANTFSATGLPTPPTTSTTVSSASTTGGTYGTPSGPSLTAGRGSPVTAPPAGAAAAAGPTGSAVDAAAAELAATGIDATAPLLVAGALLLLGSIALVAGRRPRRGSHRAA